MTTIRTYDSQPAIQEIAADGLQPEEVTALKRAINGVRAGELEYYVVVTNRKQTKSKKRMPGKDYVADPALVPYAHKGWLVAAPKNQEGEVYIHIYDEARAKSKEHNYGHTRCTMRGLRSFKIETDPRTGEEIVRPGPLADPDEPVVRSVNQPAPVGDPLLMAANAMFTQAQACTMLGQALLAQAQARAQNTPL